MAQWASVWLPDGGRSILGSRDTVGTFRPEGG
jgi:hypothetical protein